MVSIMGIGPGVVQCRTLTRAEIDDLYVFTIYIGLGICLIVLLAAPLLGLFYKSQNLTIIMYCSLPYILFSVMNTVPNALALIEKDFRFIGMRTVFFQFVSGAAAVAAAFMGSGIYSLLVAPTISSIGIFFATVRKYPVRWGIEFHLTSVKKIWGFSLYQVLFNICNLIYRNIDKVILGNVGGMAILAQYDKSYHLIHLPVDNVANVITPVLHPILAEHQNHPEVIFQSYLRLVGVIAWPAFFLTGFLFNTSRELILIFYGGKWMEAIPIFRIFALLVAPLIIQSLVGAIFQSRNDTRGMFRVSLVALSLTVIACFIGAKFASALILCYCVLLASLLIFFLYHYYLFRYTLARPFRRFFQVLVPGFFFGLGCGVLLYVWERNIAIDNVLLSFILKGSIVSPLVVVGGIYLFKKISSKGFIHAPNNAA